MADTLRRDEPDALDGESLLGSGHPNESETNAATAEVERVAESGWRSEGRARKLITVERDGYFAPSESI
ncbi:MAG: hypothetical protein H6822_20905 [Planctomycetaceae bacterium]|nr:hypothetical protein [Planctomycetales bacterium]MCB9924652.1 hypothetical protein [Planctomycetaceae bacterium]